MDDLTDENQIVIKSTGERSQVMAMPAWLFSLLAFLGGLESIFEGEVLASIGWISFSIGLAALGYWCLRSSPKNLATIDSERMILTPFFYPKLKIAWADIKTIDWRPKNKSHIVINLKQEDDHEFLIHKESLKDTAPLDKATLIAYLHLAIPEEKQINWPEHCVQTGLKALERNKLKELTKRSRMQQWIESIHTSWPYLSVPLYPITLPILIAQVVSRKTWWMVAAAIAVSSTINIRLIWGEWLPEFSELCLGSAAVMFMIGFIAPWNVLSSKPPTSFDASTPRFQLKSWMMFAYLLAAIILLPLYANACEIGWVPRWTFKFSGYAIIAAPLVVMNLYLKPNKSNLKKMIEPNSPERLEWEAFEDSLPDLQFKTQ